MNIDNFCLFLEELRRCDYAALGKEGDYIYNGIREVDGIENYVYKLDMLYNNALNDLMLIDTNSNTINLLLKRIEEINEIQRVFDIPTSETFQTMQYEIDLHHNQQLMMECTSLKFVMKMFRLQKDYLLRFAKYVALLCPNNMEANEVEEQRQIVDTSSLSCPEASTTYIIDEDKNTKQGMAYGYKGIMEAFDFGRNKTAQFLKDPQFQEAIYRTGRKIMVDIEKAKELMKMSNRPKKHPKA